MRAPLGPVVCVFLLAGCTLNADRFWRMGTEYHLTLAMTISPTLTPESQRYFEPVSDSATLLLRVDSVARDTIFGRVDGDTRHFPIAFHAVGGDRFIAVSRGERWRIFINSHATDTGLSLVGERAQNRISGDWEPRFPSPARGSFDLRPAT